MGITCGHQFSRSIIPVKHDKYNIIMYSTFVRSIDIGCSTPDKVNDDSLST
jgi:hypothetical protein